MNEILKQNILEAAVTYRSAEDECGKKNDVSRIVLKDGFRCEELGASVVDFLRKNGYDDNEQILVKVDLSVSAVRRMLLISTRGVYIFVGAGFEEDGLGEDEYASAFVSYEQLSNTSDDEGFLEDWKLASDGSVWFLIEDDEYVGAFMPAEGVAGGLIDFVVALRRIAKELRI